MHFACTGCCTRNRGLLEFLLKCICNKAMFRDQVDVLDLATISDLAHVNSEE